jgi:hypothetical protein
MIFIARIGFAHSLMCIFASMANSSKAIGGFGLVSAALLFTGVFTCTSTHLKAQVAKSDSSLSTKFRRNNYFEVGGLIINREYGGYASWIKQFALTKNRKLFFSCGIRVTGYYSLKRNYLTAPAKLTRGQTGPMAVLADVLPQNFDTVYFNASQTNGFNLFIGFQYRIWRKLDVGVDIDLIGMSIGAGHTGQYSSTKNTPGMYANGQRAYPTGFNVMLLGDNDIGCLNSEIFVRFWLNRKWGIKASFNYITTEFTTVNRLRLDNDRFRHRAFMAGLGVTFNPWPK